VFQTIYELVYEVVKRLSIENMEGPANYIEKAF